MAEGLNAAAIQDGGVAIADAINALSLHSAVPDATGSGESTAARVAVVPSSTGGVISIGSTAFTGGAANGAVAAIGFWSATTAGTFLGYQLPDSGSDTTFNAAGEYTVDSVTITGTAT